MDINKQCRNPKLEARRKLLIARQKADSLLRLRKLRTLSPPDEIQLALDGQSVGPLSDRLLRIKEIARLLRDASARPRVEALLVTIAGSSRLLDALNHTHNLPAIARVLAFRRQWIREPAAWRPGTHNVRRQFSSLVRHLFAQYPVPGFFDDAWFSDNPLHPEWFIHVGQGQNLRKARGLPIAMTKMMTHYTMTETPDGASLAEAIRYGQARGLGVNPRHAREVVGSRLANFADATQEAFWETFFRFLAQHPMIDPHQVGPNIDYLHHQKFVPQGTVRVNGVFVQQSPPQPGLSMKGRDPETLVAQVHAWHRNINRRPSQAQFAWPSCGIPGYDRIEGEPPNQRRFTITELLNSADLLHEGRKMRHCVGTYAWSCKTGRTAIYSMQVDGSQGQENLLTIEVNVRNRQITQARKRYNAPSTPADQRILHAWMTTTKSSLGKFALSRAI